MLSLRTGSGAKDSSAIRWFECFRTASVKTDIDPDAHQKCAGRLHEA